MSGLPPIVSILDYGAGNVRSLRNAIRVLGFEIKEVVTADDITEATMIIFPGVGNFGQALKSLKEKGWFEPLRKYIMEDRPFFGICIGMQSLFEGSAESATEGGLGIIPGRVARFQSISSASERVRIPQIGWNGSALVKDCPITDFLTPKHAVYFVHSYCAIPQEENLAWVLGVTDYAGQRYISIVQKGNVIATQFHPEKSGEVGLALIRNFLNSSRGASVSTKVPAIVSESRKRTRECGPANLLELFDVERFPSTQLAKRVIACLDVRSNDQGDLVVTKGDQYDVREALVTQNSNANESSGNTRGAVRNLGKPLALCQRYYEEGADEVVFLNITSFRVGVLDDLPMLQVLEKASERVFVPLTVGGGIREYTDAQGIEWSALDVTSRYFRAGADKVSIGSDAVYAVEEYLAAGRVKTGKSSIELISDHYGAQAVVVSIDPRRVYISDPAEAPGKVVSRLGLGATGPQGEEFCWWQATVKGGREARDLCAVALAKGCEDLGAGEIMLNSIDMDGQGSGYDLALISAVQSHVGLPVIASSGAGAVQHFSQVFRETDVSAALAAGIFHRLEVGIQDVKTHLRSQGIPVRDAQPL